MEGERVSGLRFAVSGLRFAVGGWQFAVGDLQLAEAKRRSTSVIAA